mmetsp:Transcript_120991/g.353513  ORF Transcript_120991/g.353513 Transcript_120991/m.353513 type:complete len:219 (+) Transcript_120991:531-1187(+)
MPCCPTGVQGLAPVHPPSPPLQNQALSGRRACKCQVARRHEARASQPTRSSLEVGTPLERAADQEGHWPCSAGIGHNVAEDCGWALELSEVKADTPSTHPHARLQAHKAHPSSTPEHHAARTAEFNIDGQWPKCLRIPIHVPEVDRPATMRTGHHGTRAPCKKVVAHVQHQKHVVSESDTCSILCNSLQLFAQLSAQVQARNYCGTTSQNHRKGCAIL